MNKKELLAGATFVTLYTGFIFTGFGWMLSSKTEPIKENQVRLEKRMENRMDRMETKLNNRMDRMETEIKVVKTELNNRMDRMETEQKDIKERIIRIESMLGQILIAQNLHHKGKAKPVSKFKKASKTQPAQRKTASH